MHRVARYGGGRCELWLTPCIVTVPPTGSAVLCVPSNERLCGTAFPHFPVGGPTPSAPLIGERARASPESAAARMLYQCESVDGAVTELGGVDPDVVARHAPLQSGDAEYPTRCTAGGAVWVLASGSLAPVFPRGLVLAVPPFWPGAATAKWRADLASTYARALALGAKRGPVAVPLLGAGARGAPVAAAAAVAAAATAEHLRRSRRLDARVKFGVIDDDAADALGAELSRALERR